ncbi:MAG TPA: ORF6N domain-containing protein [Candidatus Paceibacterota bacterium]
MDMPKRLPLSAPRSKPTKEEGALLELLQKHVFLIRGRKVILSMHLARLYGIETRVLVQAFKRNRARFPHLDVFQLNAAEFSALKSQFVISKYNNTRRSLPYAFSEQGVVILSGILQNSRNPRVIAASIAIVRAFVRPHRSYLKTQAPHPGSLW